MKKVLCILMALVLTFSCFSFTASAKEDSLFEITIESDKQKYRARDTAKFTVTVENISGERQVGVVITVGSDFLLPRDGSSKLEVDNLDPGEKVEFKLSTQVDKTAPGLGLFARIGLFFRQLFKRTAKFDEYTFDYKEKQSEAVTVRFDGALTRLEVSVWYAVLGEAELNDMAEVDSRLSMTDSVEACLVGLENDGLISDVSTTDGLTTFQYSNGVLGGYMQNSFSDTISQSDNDVSGQPKQLDPYEQAAFDRFCIGKALVLYSFNYPFESDEQSFRRPFYDSADENSCVSQWGRAQLRTELDDAVTVADLRSIDASYDVVCFSCHGSTYGGTPVLCLSERVTDENRQLYRAELLSHEIATVKCQDGKDYYWVYPSFFTSAYKTDGLKDKFIFIQSCEAFGKGSKVDERFADAMLGAGAAAVVGFRNTVNSVYGRKFMRDCVSAYADGTRAKDAFDNCTATLGASDNAYKPTGEAVATPIFKGRDGSILAEGKTATIAIDIKYPDNTISENAAVFRVLAGDGISREALIDILWYVYGQNAYLDEYPETNVSPGKKYSYTASAKQ